MNLSISLLIYFVTFIVTLTIFLRFRYRGFSAFYLSVLLSLITLIVIYPPTNDELTSVINSKTSIYFLLVIISFIVILVYPIFMALSDFTDDPEVEKDKIFAPKVVLD